MGEVLPVEGKDTSEFDEECPIKQVDLTVPKTDDPTIPAVTFRMWVLGVTACVILSFVNQFFWYRKQPLSVSSISAQIAVIPIGHFMARVLPKRPFFEGTRLEFTLNPGPFNIKEHVLITIFANSGAGSVYAAHILSAVKLYYKRSLPFLPAFLIMLTTQVLFLYIFFQFCLVFCSLLKELDEGLLDYLMNTCQIMEYISIGNVFCFLGH